jgi:hypothetical protein
MKQHWLAFNIRFPDELLPLYDFLQKELIFFLSDEESRKLIASVDYTQHRGNVWREMNKKLGARVKTWPISNRAWYGIMLFENIRREVQSKIENQIIFDELKNNDDKITPELFNNLAKKHRIYATSGRVENILSGKLKPEMAREATFQLDYTVSAPQNFTLTGTSCRIQLLDGKWLDYDILFPYTLSEKPTGKIAKPRFFRRRRDGRLIGTCAFEYTPGRTEGNGILGVDIGRVKIFSAVALYPSGRYGNEYIQNRYLKRLADKIRRLQRNKDSLYEKISRIRALKNPALSGREATLLTEYNRVRSKITNQHQELANLVGRAVVCVAKQQHCSTIHIEDLRWLKSQGGKWNHAEIHERIVASAERAGITVERVSAMNSSSQHQVTLDKGVKSGRTVTFSDGKTIDRDTLAAVNLAVRNKRRTRNKILKLKKRHPTPRQVRIPKSYRNHIRQEFKQLVKRSSQIVELPPQSPESYSGLRPSAGGTAKSSLLYRHKKRDTIYYNF